MMSGTPYRGDECPTYRIEREQARRVMKERLTADVGRFDWSEARG